MYMFCLIGKLKPVRVQLLPAAVPLPSGVKLTLSLEDSKVTRANCGLEPLRVQVTVVGVVVIFCNAAVSLVKRAKRARGCPPMLANCPPARIFPSACTAIE